MSTSILMFEPSLLMIPCLLFVHLLLLLLSLMVPSFLRSFLSVHLLFVPSVVLHMILSLCSFEFCQPMARRSHSLFILCQLPFWMTVHGSVCDQDLPRWICFGNLHLLCFMRWHMILFAKLRARSHLNLSFLSTS